MRYTASVSATPSDVSESVFQQALADPAFDPHRGFDFVEANDAVLRGMHDSDAAALNMFNHEAHSQSSLSTTAHSSAQSPPSFSPYSGATGASAPGVESGDPAGTSTSMLVGDFARINDPVYLAPTTLSRIAQDRRDSVAERYKQITPPESTPSQKGGRKSSASYSKPGQTTNLVRTERARHAANQRHAGSKQPRRIREERAGSKPGECVDEDGEHVETKKEKYREKNRIAAARCRAKKKDSTHGFEERHRDLQASHNFLKREYRRLRDELSRLRTLALQHSSDTLGCSCTDLHNYNRCKASEVAQSFNGPMVPPPSVSVPSAGGLHGMSQTNSLSPASMAELYGRPQPFPTSGSYAPTPVTLPEMYDRAMVAGSADMQQDFSCYLEDSAERSGFMR
ncbi:hypothetical protein LTS10_013135 [Elasticomyces elasticus]|nr:hypothetical protein LTS10_013135 [Elasticomyces elasticus]